MSHPEDFNVEFCRALGLNPERDHITAVTLRLRPHQAPTVVVEQELWDNDEVIPLVRLYKLEPDDDATWEDL